MRSWREFRQWSVLWVLAWLLEIWKGPVGVLRRSWKEVWSSRGVKIGPSDEEGNGGLVEVEVVTEAEAEGVRRELAVEVEVEVEQ